MLKLYLEHPHRIGQIHLRSELRNHLRRAASVQHFKSKINKSLLDKIQQKHPLALRQDLHQRRHPPRLHLDHRRPNQHKTQLQGLFNPTLRVALKAQVNQQGQSVR